MRVASLPGSVQGSERCRRERHAEPSAEDAARSSEKGTRPQAPLYTDAEGTLLPGVKTTKAPPSAEEEDPRASSGQAAGHGVRPRHRHKVHGAQQQWAHLLVLLQCLAQLLQLRGQLPDLSPQHSVLLLQALILLHR